MNSIFDHLLTQNGYRSRENDHHRSLVKWLFWKETWTLTILISLMYTVHFFLKMKSKTKFKAAPKYSKSSTHYYRHVFKNLGWRSPRNAMLCTISWTHSTVAGKCSAVAVLCVYSYVYIKICIYTHTHTHRGTLENAHCPCQTAVCVYTFMDVCMRLHMDTHAYTKYH